MNSKQEMKGLLNGLAQVIYDKKGFNILALDLRGVTSLCDFFIIAEGRVDRHVKALAEEAKHYLKEQGERPMHVEGEVYGDWIVLDYGNFMVHLFTPEMRVKYSLEEMWSQSAVIDLHIDIAKSLDKDQLDWQ